MSSQARIALPMHRVPQPDRSEAALYWTAVSLIVCERLPLEQAAERLQMDVRELRSLLARRDALSPMQWEEDELWQ